jgi:hypothetical protein
MKIILAKGDEHTVAGRNKAPKEKDGNEGTQCAVVGRLFGRC